jgi:hypothetical protein
VFRRGAFFRRGGNSTAEAANSLVEVLSFR